MAFNEEMDKYAFLCKESRLYNVDEYEIECTKDTAETLQNIMHLRLTERQCFCIEKYFFDRCTMKEIAQMTCTTRANVSKHIRSGLKRMKSEITYLHIINDNKDEY